MKCFDTLLVWWLVPVVFLFTFLYFFRKNMGVPAFFRWLSRKYSSIILSCVEEKPRVVDGEVLPVDITAPNPNDVEFDNLYLDMNGIIHPCCHPENKPAPKNENEMMVLIFEYIDRLMSIVRPRKLLYMAIDGCAPRAKMNQQRSRRFRASKESYEKVRDIAKVRAELAAKGIPLPPEKEASEHFDSNCITPGTPFMFRLADCLRYYIHDRMNNNAGWKGIKVILSDANAPGEGEHKIMDYIRRQRAQPGHNPNTHHCLCGADADLIMLGLATHEPNFTIIREEFKPNQPRPCDLCGQLGHELKECTGAAKEKHGEHDELSLSEGSDVQFIFLPLYVLREYLEKELKMTNLPFEQDMERAIDDWVLMCFFVGNDFLPHLPSLEIREGAIDRLIRLYKKAVYKTGGYLTKNGIVNLERVQLVLSDLGEAEDEIFKKRRETDLMFRKRDADKKKRQRRFNDAPKWTPGGQYTPSPVGRGANPIANPRQTASDMRQQAMYSTSNEKAAAELRGMLVQNKGNNDVPPGGTKRKLDEDEEPEPEDDVKLWEDGWKDRYYESKFDVGSHDVAFRHKVANEYVIGLCWVLRYYYQGCASWKWYFPYHYAPFASDFINIGDLPNDFEKNTAPFMPYEQLMGVFPAGSKQHLPPPFQPLMYEPESPIIDFYPIDFKIDLNGKKFAWQGVALLPFVDEKRLQKALQPVYSQLTDEEKSRNVRGGDRLFVHQTHSVHSFLEALYEGEWLTKEKAVSINTDLTEGMGGVVWCDNLVYKTDSTVPSPLPKDKCPDLHNNRVISIQFQDPQFEPDYIFQSVLLPGAKFPAKVLKPEDFNKKFPGQQYRPQIGFTPNSGYRGRGNFNTGTASRFIRGELGAGKYSNVAPPAGRPERYNPQTYNSQSGRRVQNSHSQGGNYNQGGSYGSYGGQPGGYGGQMSGYGGQQGGYRGQQGGYESQQSSHGGYYGGPQAGYGGRQQSGYGNQQGGYSSQQRGYGNQGGQQGHSYNQRSGSSRGYPNPPSYYGGGYR